MRRPSWFRLALAVMFASVAMVLTPDSIYQPVVNALSQGPEWMIAYKVTNGLTAFAVAAAWLYVSPALRYLLAGQVEEPEAERCSDRADEEGDVGHI
jgi:hypothetical protein